MKNTFRELLDARGLTRRTMIILRFASLAVAAVVWLLLMHLAFYTWRLK